MKFLKRAFRPVAIVVVVLVAVVWIQDVRSRPDVKAFNPPEMARLEASMWRSYYDGHWLQLALLTMEGGCGEFGFSWWDASRMSLHAAQAALFFRSNTNDPRCLPALEQYFTIIKNASGRDFDVHAMALLELEWWQARRRGITPQDYGRTIAQQAALYYGVPEADVLPGSVLRAEAMAYRDTRPGGQVTDAEWAEVTRQLEVAYGGLKAAIN